MELSGQQDLLSCSWNPESSPASPARGVSPASFPLGSPSPGVHLRADCWALLSLGPGPGRRAGAAGLLWGLLLTSASPWSALPRPVAKAGSAHGPLPGGRWAADLVHLRGEESGQASKAAGGFSQGLAFIPVPVPLSPGLQPNLLPFPQQQSSLLLPQPGPGLASQVNPTLPGVLWECLCLTELSPWSPPAP